MILNTILSKEFTPARPIATTRSMASEDGPPQEKKQTIKGKYMVIGFTIQ